MILVGAKRARVSMGVLMLKAAKRRDADHKHGMGWGCCDRFGSMYHVNGIQRVVKYCPACKPLARRWHRCKLAVDGYAPERWEQVKQRRREMRSLGKLAAILKSNAEDHPYTGSMTPLCDFRGSWGGYVVEYYHRADNGVTVLNVRRTGEAIDDQALRDLRAAFSVPGKVTETLRERDDGAHECKMEWAPTKQAPMFAGMA